MIVTDLVVLAGVACKWTRDLRGSMMVTDLGACWCSV
jgi:hypothetical protein